MDALTLHNDLDQLESEIAINNKELNDLKNMHIEAKQTKEILAEEGTIYEQEVYQARVSTQ